MNGRKTVKKFRFGRFFLCVLSNRKRENDKRNGEDSLLFRNTCVCINLIRFLFLFLRDVHHEVVVTK